MVSPISDTEGRRGSSGMIPGREVIRRQVQMPMRTVVEMAWRGIRLRPGRSLLVTSGIVLAVAFLSQVLVGEAIQQGIEASAPRPLLESLRKEGKLTGAAESQSTSQTRWVVGLAMLVGLVGVINSMLLSVTERFAEIGTMKCLGALDSLIVKLFLWESLLQGLVGTFLGGLVGLGLAVLGAWADCGGQLWPLIPAAQVMHLLGMSMLAGVGLTVSGALYPAWRAAHMRPVEAMRHQM
jgi:predicted lysophospholipase L1 biosynthesis ABC-type transport system permease subunit